MKPIFNYFAASRAELAKVTWPSRRQTIRLTTQVIVFSIALAAILGLLDLLFQQVIAKLIIKG